VETVDAEDIHKGMSSKRLLDGGLDDSGGEGRLAHDVSDRGVVKDGEHKLLELHLHCKEQLLRRLRAPPPVEEDEEESGQVGWQRMMAVLRVSMLLGQVGFYGSVLNMGQASPLYMLISVGLMSLLLGQPKVAHVHPDT
jgi:hypothetical protein